jgi:hypothetical protein
MLCTALQMDYAASKAPFEFNAGVGAWRSTRTQKAGIEPGPVYFRILA